MIVKRYDRSLYTAKWNILHTEMQYGKHLSSLVSDVKEIIILDDIRSACEILNNHDYNNEELTDDYIYTMFSDNQLLALDDRKIHSFTKPELVERVNDLDPGRLSEAQHQALLECFRSRIIIDALDVSVLLGKLKACNSVSHEKRYPHSNPFLVDRSGNFKDAECLSMIHQLETCDYYCEKVMIFLNPLKIGDLVLKFEPDAVWVFEDKSAVFGLKVNVKYVIQAEDSAAIAFISMCSEKYVK